MSPSALISNLEHGLRKARDGVEELSLPAWNSGTFKIIHAPLIKFALDLNCVENAMRMQDLEPCVLIVPERRRLGENW